MVCFSCRSVGLVAFLVISCFAVVEVSVFKNVTSDFGPIRDSSMKQKRFINFEDGREKGYVSWHTCASYLPMFNF